MARKIQLKNKSGEILHPETEVSAITDLVANPGGNGLTELTSIKIGDTSYKVAASQNIPNNVATTEYVDNRVNAVLGGDEIAEAYDTMKEIADYLDEHDNYIDQLSNTSVQANNAMVGVNNLLDQFNPQFLPKVAWFEFRNLEWQHENYDMLQSFDVYYECFMGMNGWAKFTVYPHKENRVANSNTPSELEVPYFSRSYSWNGRFSSESEISQLDSTQLSQEAAERYHFSFTRVNDEKYDQTTGNYVKFNDAYELRVAYDHPDGMGKDLPSSDNAVSGVLLSSEDLTDSGSLLRAGDVNIPTAVSQLTNDSGYLTSTALNGYALQANVPSALSDLNNDTGFITGTALSGLATETYVDNKVAEVNIPTKTSDLTNDSGYITNAALSGLATKDDVNGSYTMAVGAIPTNVSQLNNDMGYITSHQSLAGLATETYVNNAIKEILGEGEVSANFDTIKEVADYLTQHGSDYASLVSAVNGKANAADVPTKVSDLTNDSGFITSSALNGYALSSQIPTVDVTANGNNTFTGNNIFRQIEIKGTTEYPFISASSDGFLTFSSPNGVNANIGMDNFNRFNIGTTEAETHLKSANLDINVNQIALKSEIPEKVSDLTNDTGFITSASLQPYALAADVPTKVSDLQNDSGFITSSALTNKQDKLTAGAGITINENNVISAAGVGGVSYQVISEFPETGVEGTIYLKSKGGRNKDVYEEYIWVNNDFELIGSTEIDLSGYAQTANLAKVATTGSYNDLSDTPAIPSTDDFATMDYAKGYTDYAIAHIGVPRGESIPNGAYLHSNEETGELEWSTISAGSGTSADDKVNMFGYAKEVINEGQQDEHTVTNESGIMNGDDGQLIDLTVHRYSDPDGDSVGDIFNSVSLSTDLVYLSADEVIDNNNNLEHKTSLVELTSNAINLKSNAVTINGNAAATEAYVDKAIAKSSSSIPTSHKKGTYLHANERTGELEWSTIDTSDKVDAEVTEEESNITKRGYIDNGAHVVTIGVEQRADTNNPTAGDITTYIEPGDAGLMLSYSKITNVDKDNNTEAASSSIEINSSINISSTGDVDINATAIHLNSDKDLMINGYSVATEAYVDSAIAKSSSSIPTSHKKGTYLHANERTGELEWSTIDTSDKVDAEVTAKEVINEGQQDEHTVTRFSYINNVGGDVGMGVLSKVDADNPTVGDLETRIGSGFEGITLGAREVTSVDRENNTEEQVSMIELKPRAIDLTSEAVNINGNPVATINDIEKHFGTPDTTTDGTYVLKAVVRKGEVSYSWVLEA